MKLRPDILLISLASGALLLSGCAKKSYVRATVAPVEARVGEVEQASVKNADAIESLGEDVDRDVSRLEERISSVADDAKTADEKAALAQQSAETADEKARDARTFAASGIDRVEKRMADMANYRMAAKESVLFDFNSSQIGDEGKTRLAAVGQAVDGKKTFVIEVQGFTDSTGDPIYNLGLSERRAENVVRALTARYGIPLRSIHRVGLGEIEGENTKESRKMNRRVDVSVWIPLSDDGLKVSQN